MKKFLNRFLLVPLLITSFALPSYGAGQIVSDSGIVAGLNINNPSFSGSNITSGLSAVVASNRNVSDFPTSDARYTEAGMAIQGGDSSNIRHTIFGSNGIPHLSFVKWNGTAASKTNTGSGNMALVTAHGYANSTITGTRASIGFDATEAWGTSANGTKIVFFTTPIGSTTLATRMELDENGITATDGKIKFPATQSASSNANTLDDYEEGTWTPIDSSGAGLSFTISGTPSYIKIGTLVYCFGTITFPVTASGAAVLIGGLPFAAKSNGGGAEVGTVQLGYNTIAAGAVMGLVNQNATTFKLFSSGSVVVTNAAASAKVFVFTAIYPAAN